MRATVVVVVGLSVLVLPPALVSGRQQSEPARGAPAAPPATELSPQLARILAPRAGGEAPTAERLSAALVALGPSAVPELCALLTGELEPPRSAHGTTDQPIHPRALLLYESALHEALARFDPELVARELAGRAATGELDRRLTCIRLLGATPCRAAFEALLEAAAGIEPVHLMRAYVQAVLEPALARQLAREPALASTLRLRLASLPPELLPIVAAAAARTARRESVELLGELLGRSGELDRVVVPALTGCVEGVDVDLDHPLRAKLRLLLSSPEPRSRRAAASALGRLLDNASVEELLELLEDEDSRVRASAQQALGAICGGAHPSDPEAWREWLAGEESWLVETAPALFEALASEDPAEVHRALAELVTHPFHRHEIADRLRVVFHAGHPDSVRVAIGVALHLRSPRSAPHLARLWERSEGLVREEAARAVLSMSGKPPAPGAARRSP